MVQLLFFPFFFLLFRESGGLDYSFRTLAKNICNFLMRSLITLKCVTNKEHIKVNSGTQFGMNLISIQCVGSIDSHRK